VAGQEHPAKARVCIVSASGQNVFFAELLDAIGNTLAAAGLHVERSVDRFPPWRHDLVYLFVPHEYTPLVAEEARPSEEHLQRSVVLCTEQPGTGWFEETSAMALRAAAAVDINPLGARELKRRGIKASSLLLGYVAEWDRWRGDEKVARPIDVVFMGGYTPRRARALARCAPFLAGRRAELTITETSHPHLADSTDFLSGERRWAALGSSKLLINVHRSELRYLEWLRVIGAMVNGCVVVTEHSIGFRPLVPGEHFVSVSYDHLPFALDALLEDPGRIREIRQAAYCLLRDELRLSSTVAPLIKAVQEVAATSVEPGFSTPAPTGPMPLPPSTKPTEYERISTHLSDLDRVKGAVKDLVLGQFEVRRHLAEQSVDPSSLADVVHHVGPRDRAVRVSVALTVYNYADVVFDAIGSVAGSDFESYEVVVVDDGSRDDSLAVVREELSRYPWIPATIVARGRNQGLAAARNCAVEYARGELIFILDADNQIYPHALGRLTAALDDASRASFAYGVVEQFGPEGPRDLMSWHSWDAGRLRYGNYIDAMAMIRRAAIMEAGGYTLDRRLFGWEDFDLWCAFADRGLSGVRVPEILARYRTGLYSMISTTNIDGQAAWSALVERHQFLAASRETVPAKAA
jgi:hypothetical protein